ncbi:hypothetical protein Pmar_PMAR020489 [Perkinsus marinus ATCC 50983]|uniref:Uncharacterized protein n=1 Tax=Perkinsus marinus (strain ATCC 50983 / TXsc) TaxID=423536 RepID=C5L762_PERM5|nr:hypothetical protein Pmar_PMAR020489 [Perkinsus marinus ATCC 50983]EER07324.1 hypothetical protein Pmar_PMAR020489 [Perkinsus marinus ATCC 50983]|eukprot:XP_002775508.1 hypothetical protein Pmar_PMAR020489 [Perkinsus marinus ATCC 50983]
MAHSDALTQLRDIQQRLSTCIAIPTADAVPSYLHLPATRWHNKLVVLLGVVFLCGCYPLGAGVHPHPTPLHPFPPSSDTCEPFMLEGNNRIELRRMPYLLHPYHSWQRHNDDHLHA